MPISIRRAWHDISDTPLTDTRDAFLSLKTALSLPTSEVLSPFSDTEDTAERAPLFHIDTESKHPPIFLDTRLAANFHPGAVIFSISEYSPVMQFPKNRYVGKIAFVWSLILDLGHFARDSQNTMVDKDLSYLIATHPT